MSLISVAETQFSPTDETALQGPSPDGKYNCVFVDDGATGYFYALSASKLGSGISDAVLVYSYTNGNNSKGDYSLRIAWTESNTICVLSVDGHLYALFDFETRTGYNATGFPDPGNGWKRIGSIDEAYALLGVTDVNQP